MPGAINTVLGLDRLGVPVVSVREPWLDNTGPVRSLLVAIFGWVAEQERSRLIERTRAGLARARAQGKRLGRPRASQFALASAADLVTPKEWSARALKVPHGRWERTALRSTLQPLRVEQGFGALASHTHKVEALYGVRAQWNPCGPGSP
ncbi:recombinase family protein [Aggregicoccus sp. 17bor-14]|uniref:recombinase family protein n=1 Tax=Myxococcaceae TaxID=31 RepID=UPI00129C1307|nr:MULTISPECIES: recombinase family protein [Myxococcaceae]MBF5046406.1 recombinase family protein [Simulacricoccus sp. 17bor-14]MRI92126.1 recombinase family protein [Aggregicoccus sp. 17bor-14]